MPEKLSDIEYFHLFCESPTSFDKKVLSGSIRHIQKIIKGEEPSPKRAIFIDIFNNFVAKDVKDYVYARMKKSLLEELALRLLTDILQGGPERLKTIEVLIEKTSAGGKQLVIPPNDKAANDEFAVSPDEAAILLHEIDGVEGTLRDKSGNSPDVKFSVAVCEKIPRVAKAKAKKSLKDSFDKVGKSQKLNIYFIKLLP